MINNLSSQESLLLLSLLTKPFSILYGVSWTWKSRIVKELWKKLYWEEYTKYFHKESVPPNWFDESEIIWRYNEIEKYKEWSFIKKLEEAIKDPEHNYVYLLDEMNLSHIEQYFAQYLCAVEDLNNWNAWINIWDTNNYYTSSIICKNDEIIRKSNYLNLNIDLQSNISNNNVSNIYEKVIDINNPFDLTNKKFVRWIFKINWEEKLSEYTNSSDAHKAFQDFNRKIFKYIINKKIISNEILERDFWIKEIEKIKNENNKLFDKLKISWEKSDYNKYDIIETLEKNYYDNWVIIILNSTHDWTQTLYYYKWYYFRKNVRNKTLQKIIEIVKYLWNDALNWLEIVFKDESWEEVILKNIDNKNKEINNENSIETKQIESIVYYYNDNNELIWKSLKLPKNLFVVGTINLDETTKSISPKVVDRANIIEFNDLDNFLFINDTNKYDLDFLKYLNISDNYIETIKKRIEDNQDISEENKVLLQKLYDYLKIFKLHFSYRTLNEILIFIAIWKELWVTDENKLLDLAIMQKILPKLNWVIDCCFSLYNNDKYLTYSIEDRKIFEKHKELLSNWIIDGEKYPNSALKLQRMQQFFDTYQNVNYFLS